ncbi:MAG: NrtA/SsuA/CpmA family ABC transporter substrate-binding protein [Thermodesulfovibrionales bacterium]
MLLISGLLSCLISCKKQEKSPGPPERITIAYSTASNAVLVYIAFAKGYFAEEGLEATLQPHAFGKLALNAVIAKKADMATVGDTPIVFAVMNGEKITTLAVIQTSDKNEAIVARQDRGITKPADLNDKSIGVPFGTTADFFVYSFLLAHGIEKKQVRLIDMKPDEMAGALDSGRVDAVSTFNPTIKQLQKGLGTRGIVFFGESLYTETFCVTAGQEYVKKNPEAIKKVLRALIRAETFVKLHDEEAKRLVAEFIKIDMAVLDEIWDIFRFRVTLDQALLVDFEEQTRWALKNRLTARTDMPNYLDYIYTDGLYAVKPVAVRIVR